MKRKFLKATSLVETLAAMVITVSAFAGGFMIYRNVLKSHRFLMKLTAKELVAMEMDHIRREQGPGKMETRDGILVKTTGKEFREAEGVTLYEVITLNSDGEKVYSQKHLVYDGGAGQD